MRKKLSFMLLLLVAMTSLLAQTQTVSGVVMGPNGQPVENASVLVKGTRSGVSANTAGRFSITVNQGAVLVISAVGFTSKEIKVGKESSLSVRLESATNTIDEVVVTALGVSRSKKSVGYAAQELSSERLNTTKVADLNTALVGKVSGIQARGGSGAKFGTTSIRIRGVNTLTGGNPIYVVDGIITSSGNINPDDVESLTVLKGPAATALYGQRASEGAIVVTSKKAKKNGMSVDLSHTTTLERVYVLPEYQNEYGGGSSQTWNVFTYNPATMPANLAGLNGAKWYRYDVDESWGPKMDGTMHAPWYAWDPSDPEFGVLKPFVAQPNNIRDFYRTGVANNTTVGFTSKTEGSTTRVSFTNLSRTGVTPNSRMQKNFVSLNNTINVSKAFSVTTNFNYVYQYLFNVPAEGYGAQTIGSFNQWFHRNVEIEKLKRFQRADGSYTSWNITSPTNLTAKYWDNPYTEAYANWGQQSNQNIYGSLAAQYKFDFGLKLSAIAKGNFTNGVADGRVASYTINTAQYAANETKATEMNYVASAEYENNFGDLSLRSGIYAELRSNNNYTLNSSTNGGFIIPNVFNLSNSLNEKTATNAINNRKVNSLYGFASLGYKNFLYLDLNLRNDVSSTLPKDNNSYVYGGVSGSFVFSEFLPKTGILNFGKIRASVARVGSDVGAYALTETYPLGAVNYVKPVGATTTTYSTQTIPNQMPNNELKPSLSTSWEIGTEMQFLKNRLRFDVNYFYRESKDQIIAVSIPGSTGYQTKLINAGNIRNKGWEITVGGAPIRNRDFSWNLDLNLGFFDNRVIELAPDITNLQVSLDGSNASFGFVGTPAASLNAYVNQPYGMIKGQGIKRDANGRALIDDFGDYVREDDKLLGNSIPDITGGLTSAFTYKNWFLNFTMDFQKGGKFVSLSKMLLNGSGLGIESAGLNDKGIPKRDPVASGGGVRLEGVNVNTGKENTVYVDAQTMYEGNLSTLWEHWTYDASYVKLRELAIGCNLPKSWFKKLPIQNASLSLIGQNLWLIWAKAGKGFDPSELQQPWIETAQLPGTRSIGAKLNITF